MPAAEKKIKRFYPKGNEPETSVLAKFLEPEKEIVQMSARLPRDVLDRFREVCESEGISMYKGTEIAMIMLCDFFEKKTANLK